MTEISECKDKNVINTALKIKGIVLVWVNYCLGNI